MSATSGSTVFGLFPYIDITTKNRLFWVCVCVRGKVSVVGGFRWMILYCYFLMQIRAETITKVHKK